MRFVSNPTRACVSFRADHSFLLSCSRSGIAAFEVPRAPNRQRVQALEAANKLHGEQAVSTRDLLDLVKDTLEEVQTKVRAHDETPFDFQRATSLQRAGSEPAGLPLRPAYTATTRPAPATPVASAAPATNVFPQPACLTATTTTPPYVAPTPQYQRPGLGDAASPAPARPTFTMNAASTSETRHADPLLGTAPPTPAPAAAAPANAPLHTTLRMMGAVPTAAPVAAAPTATAGDEELTIDGQRVSPRTIATMQALVTKLGFSLSQGQAQYDEVASRRITGIITQSDDSVVLHMNRERGAELANFDIGIGLANREMTRGYLVRLHLAAKVLPTGNDYAEALSKTLDKEFGVELSGEAITKEIAPAYDTWRALQRAISRNDNAPWAYDSHVQGAAITLVDAYLPRDLLVDGMKVGVRAYQALQSLRTRIVDTISHAMQLSATQRNVLYELRSDAAVTKAAAKNALAFNFFDKLPTRRERGTALDGALGPSAGTGAPQQGGSARGRRRRNRATNQPGSQASPTPAATSTTAAPTPGHGRGSGSGRPP